MLNYILNIVLLICFSVVIWAFQADVDYDGLVTIKLQHSLDPIPSATFKDRGLVNVQSIRTGSVALQQSVLASPDIEKLMKLAAEDGLYRLRCVVRGMDGKEVSLLTFVKACSLVESHLSDILTVSLDHAGTVIAVSMTASQGVCEGRYVAKEDLKHFNTTVFVKHMEVGPVPDTAAYIQKLEREKEARERGETKDNRSFLAKYWMYIVPVVIFVVLSGAANPEGGAGGGGGGR